jgi:long-chain acyl-CoA synthetase
MLNTAMPTSVGEIVTRSAARWGTKTALVFDDLRLSFAEIDAQSSVAALRLQARGIGKGDRVSLYAPNGPEWVVLYYAILKLGAVANPLNLMLTPDEAAYAMADCGARAVVGTADRIAGLAGVLDRTRLELLLSFGGAAPPGAVDLVSFLAEPVAPGAAAVGPVAGLSLDDTCAVAYTSGTTGHPKGAVLTHRAVLMNTAMAATMHLRTAQDTVASALPCSHVYGNIVLNATLMTGGTLVLHRAFDAGRMVASIARERCTMLEGVPTMYMYLLGFAGLSDHDISSLTRCTVGGQTMPESQMRAVEALLDCPLIELWGMTELAGLGTTHSIHGPKRLGSIGVALPHLEARIAPVEGEPRALPAREIGELQIRGPVTMREYLGQPEATTETLLPGGWLRTGDLAHMDDEGFIFIVDRLKDIIITAGFNIYPAELERVIAEHPDVAMVAVGGIPDAIKGELAKAYVVLKAGKSPSVADLEAHCRARLAAYKVPRAFQFVVDLPKTSTGKVLRRHLKTMG